jgi:hypothetical protein
MDRLSEAGGGIISLGSHILKRSQMHGLGFSELTLALIVGFLTVLPFWKMLGKAGYHPAWSLVVFVPIVNVIALYIFAFSYWPNLNQTKK